MSGCHNPYNGGVSEEVITMIDDCIKRASKMSEWEQRFIESLKIQANNDKGLTHYQSMKLEDIWEKVTR